MVADHADGRGCHLPKEKERGGNKYREITVNLGVHSPVFLVDTKLVDEPFNISIVIGLGSG